MELQALSTLGLIGAGYVVLRIVSRLIAGYAGGRMSGLPHLQRIWIGTALMAQAGVAVGMALVAAERFPEFSDVIVSTVIAATVVFELSGTVLTRVALTRVGEVPDANRANRAGSA